MSDEKKYYYLKLKENFFDTDEMIALESLPDGTLFANILLKLYLRSLKHEGRLTLTDRIPYNIQILANIVRQPASVVDRAIEAFKALNMVEVLDNGAIYMLDIQNMIGKSSTEADRIRNYRMKIAQEKALTTGTCTNVRTNVQEMSYKRTPEIRDKSIENRDYIYSDSSNDSSIPPKKVRQRKKFTPPTLEEVKAYAKSRGNVVDAKRFFDYFEAADWHDSQGKPVKNWKQKMITWESHSNNSQPTQPSPQYSAIDMSQYDMAATIREAESQRRMDALLMEDNDAQ